MASFCL